MQIQLNFEKNCHWQQKIISCFNGYTERIEVWQNGMHLGGASKLGKKLILNFEINPKLPVFFEYYGSYGNYTTTAIDNISCPETYQFDDGTQFSLKVLHHGSKFLKVFSSLFYSVKYEQKNCVGV